MAHYISVEEARPLSGMRLVTTQHFPGPWSEAAKNILHVKGVPYVLVAQIVGDENRALKEWTAQTSAPVMAWNDERPRSTWIEQLYLAERIAPEPSLIPADQESRILMFGLCNELCGENGYGWNMRLVSTHRSLSQIPADDPQRQVSQYIADKYNYDTALLSGARRQMTETVKRLDSMLKRQRDAGRKYLIGDSLTALDIHWTAWAGAIEPVRTEWCPILTDDIRRAYTDPEMREIAGDALFEHRDFIYRTHLKLPMDF